MFGDEHGGQAVGVRQLDDPGAMRQEEGMFAGITISRSSTYQRMIAAIAISEIATTIGMKFIEAAGAYHRSISKPRPSAVFPTSSIAWASL